MRRPGEVGGAPHEVATILVLATHGIGDVLMITPLLESLRGVYPQAEMEVLLRSGVEAEVLEGRGLRIRTITLNSLRTVRGLGRQVQRWRRRGVDLAIATYNVHAAKAYVLALAAGSKYMVGFVRGRRRVPFDIVLQPVGLHKVEENLRVLGALGHKPEPSIPRWPLLPAEVAWAEAFLSRTGLGARALVAVAPGSNPTEPFKRWPVERFREVLARLRVPGGLDVIVLGAVSDRDLGQALAAAPLVDGRVTNLAGETTIRQAAALLSRCDLALASEGGMAHVASALNRPTIVVTGPTRPEITGPRGEQTVIVRSDHYCVGCYERELRIDPACRAPACMEAVGVDRLTVLVERVLRSRSVPAAR